MPAAFVAEAVEFLKPASIDRDRGIVHGVRVLNPTSRNRRAYPEPVLRAAVDKYAARCNLGHHRHPVTGVPVDAPPEKRFGRHANPRIVAGGVTTDFRYNPKHEYAAPFLWAVENDPGSVCFSPLHNCEWAVEADGRRTARAVLEVASVDLVTDGGTTAGVFESFAAGAADPKAVAGSLATPGAWLAFLADLFKEMTGVDQATREAIRAVVMAALDGAADPAADPERAAHRARLQEAVGLAAESRWAIGSEPEADARRAWARERIDLVGFRPGEVSALFVDLVAECYPDTRAALRKAVDRRKALDPPFALDLDAERPAKSVEELVAGYGSDPAGEAVRRLVDARGRDEGGGLVRRLVAARDAADPAVAAAVDGFGRPPAWLAEAVAACPDFGRR